MPGGGTVTYLFSQPGSLADALEAAADARRDHLRLLRRAAPGSRPMKILGDGVILVFTSAVEAVSCAQAIQRAASGPAGGGQAAPRVALHAGEPIADDALFYEANCQYFAGNYRAAEGSLRLLRGQDIKLREGGGWPG